MHPRDHDAVPGKPAQRGRRFGRAIRGGARSRRGGLCRVLFVVVIDGLMKMLLLLFVFVAFTAVVDGVVDVVVVVVYCRFLNADFWHEKIDPARGLKKKRHWERAKNGSATSDWLTPVTRTTTRNRIPDTRT